MQKTGMIVHFRGVKLGFDADMMSNGKFDPQTIVWDEGSYNFLNSIEDDKEYFDWIDGLCAELDKTDMFNEPVSSLDLNY